jgi:hypothetical protein
MRLDLLELYWFAVRRKHMFQKKYYYFMDRYGRRNRRSLAATKVAARALLCPSSDRLARAGLLPSFGRFTPPSVEEILRPISPYNERWFSNPHDFENRDPDMRPTVDALDREVEIAYSLPDGFHRIKTKFVTDLFLMVEDGRVLNGPTNNIAPTYFTTVPDNWRGSVAQWRRYCAYRDWTNPSIMVLNGFEPGHYVQGLYKRETAFAALPPLKTPVTVTHPHTFVSYEFTRLIRRPGEISLVVWETFVDAILAANPDRAAHVKKYKVRDVGELSRWR